MKLSEIHGERVFDVIAEVIDPIANIMEDEKIAGLFKREKLPEGVTARKHLAQKAKKFAPVLLKDHKTDIISILASIAGVSAAEYTKTLTIVSLLNDTTDLLSDDAFMELFISAQNQTTSGSAQENTKAPKV